MLGWFQALMPKEERFFDLFERHAETLVSGARALRALLEGGDGVIAHAFEIALRESGRRRYTRECCWPIRRTFITPFDRSDIRDLITAMDDAIDQMHQTAKATQLYETSEFEPPMRRMGDIIVQAAELTRDAVPLLRAWGRNAAQAQRLQRGDHPHRGRGRRHPRSGAEGSVQRASPQRSDGLHRRRRDLRSSREGRRRFRGRRQPGQRHRHRASLGGEAAMHDASFALVGLIRSPWPSISSTACTTPRTP